MRNVNSFKPIPQHPIKNKAVGFISSLMERKFLWSIYMVFEKWILLTMVANYELILDNYLLIFIFGKDIVILSLLGIVAFEKIRLEYSK